MFDILENWGIGTILIILSALYGLLRKAMGSSSYNDELRKEMEKKNKKEMEPSKSEQKNIDYSTQ